MSRVSDRLMLRAQHVVVAASWRWHKGRSPSRRVSWVVGPIEIASIVANFARAVPESYSVSLAPHRYYDFSYDLTVPTTWGDWLRRRLVAAWAFGNLATHARGFVYVGADGFLLGDIRDREWEFRFLNRKGVGIACVFTGSDIRSPVLMRRLQADTGQENIVTYLDQVSPVFASVEYDNQRERVAEIADRYADVIFNASVDQLSYLKRETQPFPYFYPDEDILESDEKHAAPGPRIVVHAPSSPIIKGTQVVRAAIRRLESEGYEFDYRELIGVPHVQVIQALKAAHIVLNEFYAFVPGVFGVEAMANGCALLTRADETIETDLPPGSNNAWLVTPASDIYTNLRSLLDNPDRIQQLGACGRDWVRAHATVSASGARVSRALAQYGDSKPASR